MAEQPGFSQGDAADSVFYIRRGQAQLTVLSRQGKEAVIGILGPGDFFGEGCLAGQTTRMASAFAWTDCSIVRMEKAAIIRILHQEPVFSEMFLMHVLSRNIRIGEDLVDQLFNSNEKRLARVLLLANFGKTEEPQAVIPKISQETMAEIIGNDPLAGEFLHEPVPEAGVYRLQRRAGGSQLAAERGAARLAAKLKLR